MIETAAQFETVVGGEVVLRLDRQGIGGYVWTVEPLPPGVRLVAEPVQESAVAAVGGGALLTYRLATGLPGNYRVVFELRRPWGDRAIAERRTVTLKVEPR